MDFDLSLDLLERPLGCCHDRRSPVGASSFVVCSSCGAIGQSDKALDGAVEWFREVSTP